MKMFWKITDCESLENPMDIVYFNVEFVFVKLQIYSVKTTSP